MAVGRLSRETPNDTAVELRLLLFNGCEVELLLLFSLSLFVRLFSFDVSSRNAEVAGRVLGSSFSAARPKCMGVGPRRVLASCSVAAIVFLGTACKAGRLSLSLLNAFRGFSESRLRVLPPDAGSTVTLPVADVTSESSRKRSARAASFSFSACAADGAPATPGAATPRLLLLLLAVAPWPKLGRVISSGGLVGLDDRFHGGVVSR